MHFTVCISKFVFYSMHFTVCILQYAFHSMHFKVCISQYAFHTICCGPPRCSSQGACLRRPSSFWPNLFVVSVKFLGVNTGDTLKQQRSSHLTFAVSNISVQFSAVSYSLKSIVRLWFKYVTLCRDHLVAGLVAGCPDVPPSWSCCLPCPVPCPCCWSCADPVLSFTFVTFLP